MADQRDGGISWTDETWNPVRGCSRVSLGCGGPHGQGGCYAERLAIRFSGPGQPYEGLVKSTPNGPRWTGKMILVEPALDLPLRWKRPRRIFTNSMSDLFHENLPFESIDAVFAVMDRAQQHTFQVLTKRPARMLEYCSQINGRPLANVWLGVSVEDQATADERIPLLLRTPAALRFVSYEPALGVVNFSKWLRMKGHTRELCPMCGIDLVICGGESGPHARPCEIAWLRSSIAQCRATNTAIFVKQVGASPVWGDETSSLGRALREGGYQLKDRAGADPSEWPEDLRVREFPI